MLSSGFARSWYPGLALGAVLAFGACGAASERPDEEAVDGEGGAGSGSGGSGGKASGSGGRAGGTGGMLASKSGGTSGGGGSGAGDGGNGGNGSGDGGSGGSGSGGSGGGSGGSGSVDARQADGGTTGQGGGGAVPTFTALYDTVFGIGTISKTSCWGAKCHNPGTSGKVDVSTKAKAYTTLLAKVKPGNPAGSALVTHLETTDVKKRMPLNKPPLDAAVIAQVKAWIMAGAKND